MKEIICQRIYFVDYVSGSNPDNIFMCKYDVAGNLVWAKKIGDGGDYSCIAMALDNNGNLFAGIRNELATDANPGSGIFTVPANSSFLLKLDSSGNFVYAKALVSPSPSYSIIAGIAFDPLGNVYLSGSFSGTVDFDPGAATYNLSVSTSGSPTSSFIEKLTPLGDFTWVRSFGGTRDEAMALVVDLFGSVYTIGRLGNSVDFDPGPGVYSLSSASISGFDTYIHKLTTDGDFVWAYSTAVPSSGYVDPAYLLMDSLGRLYVNGTFSGQSVDFDPTSGVFIQNASGYVTDFILSLNSCSINSIVSQTACSEYTYNGITYTSSGTYGQSFGPGSGGCDSTVTLNITIDSPNNVVTQSGNVLTAVQTGASYQWINCATGTPIAGETSQNFTITASGNYAVEIIHNGCVDTSACALFIYVGSPENSPPLVNVFPSPFNESINIDYKTNSGANGKAEVRNMLGQLVYETILVANVRQQVLLSDLEKGMYVLKIYDEDAIFQKQIIKQ